MANACTDLTDAVRSVQQLKINGFCATSAMSTDYSIKSRWNVDGYEWEIRIYPASGTFSVAVELAFLSEPRTPVVRANLSCRLVDPRGVAEPSERTTNSGAFWRPKGRFSTVFVNLGQRRDLVASSYLKDDTLIVECTITVLKELPAPTISVKPGPYMPPSNLHEHFGELLRSRAGSDVEFLVSGESFAAHKLVLSARSPVFMAKFFGNMKEACSRSVEIKDMESDVFRALLGFIYTDAVPELDQELEAVPTMAQHLLAAADRYGLDRLKVICAGKLSGGITVDTAATTLALAEQLNCSHLKAKCVEFITSTPAILDAVVASEGYKHLEESCPSALTSIVISMRATWN
ncbi:hypothetical protein CFC21_104926 [Triticum aestivum]|uniref:BTB domain-containing protein n=2 Tax=Triticum aestivum TaxID=4565 RepID=A0A9R1MBQ6_WHEAT|nr:BTB/POZ and MATH domain-containing protein 1-like [Triticum aestivum]KAF7103998.1 hypothetical protein CFC21_104926 [Triticum aestivum]